MAAMSSRWRGYPPPPEQGARMHMHMHMHGHGHARMHVRVRVRVRVPVRASQGDGAQENESENENERAVETVPVVVLAPQPQPQRDACARKARVLLTGLQLHGRLTAGQPPRQVGAWLAERLVQLGPTYIKLGQFIASRRDVYGREFASEFDGMRDSVRPVPPEEAERMIAESGLDLTRFASIDYAAAAAASMAQVHRGTLQDGRRVVVKVLRPHVRDDVFDDMAFLSALTEVALAAAWVLDAAGRAGPLNALRQMRASVSDLAGFLDEELDLSREAGNIAAFARIYPQTHGYVRVPRLVADACGPRAIVMEDLPSRGISTATGAPVAQRLMREFIEQLVSHGLLHGDPHAGNVGVAEDGRFVLYDFGSVVRLSRGDVRCIKDLLVALVGGDQRASADALRGLGADVLDEKALGRYLVLYRRYLRDLDVSALVASAERQSRDDRTTDLPVLLPGRISRIARSFALLEGVCKGIDPAFNYFDTFASTSSGSLASMGDVAALVLDDDYLRHRARRDVSEVLKSLSRSERSAMASILRAVANDEEL